MRIIDTNLSVLIFSVILSATSAFEARFNTIELPVKRFSEWRVTVEAPAEKKIKDSIDSKASRIKSALGMFQFLTNESLAVRELGTEVDHEVLGFSPAVCTFELREGQV